MMQRAVVSSVDAHSLYCAYVGTKNSVAAKTDAKTLGRKSSLGEIVYEVSEIRCNWKPLCGASESYCFLAFKASRLNMP